MIYRVVLDDTIDIHTSDINCMLLNPSIELEMNSAGSFKFTLPPTHPNWDDIRVLKSTIDVYENNELIFTGRVASIEKNWNNERVVDCEGALAYFNDSIHRQMKWGTPLPIASEDPTVHNFLKDILDNHNVFEGSENLNRHIYVGHIYVDPELVTREVDYNTTLDILTRMCIDTNGGYFQIRKDPEDGKLYLDWLKDFTDESSQPASFGLNLLDFNTSLNAEDICTGVLARGATVNDQVVTLNDVELVDKTTYPDMSVDHYTDHDQDILWHREGVSTFGQVVQVHDFSDAQIAWKDQGGQIVANSLFEVAKKWLEEKNTKVETIEVEVAELNWLGEGYPQFKLGQIVELMDSVHMSGESETTRRLPMYKLSCDLTSGSKKVTLGTPPKKELTQISASNSDSSTLSSTSSSGSSGGGSGSGEECKVTDVKVDGTSVVSNKVANISLTGKADTSTVNALAATVATKADTSTVNTLANAVAGKQDQIEFNTQEAATETLTRLKANGTVYNIPSGGGGGSHNYSENEQFMGTWIDGSDMYEITVDKGSVAPSGSLVMDRKTMLLYEVLTYLKTQSNSLLYYTNQSDIIWEVKAEDYGTDAAWNDLVISGSGGSPSIVQQDGKDTLDIPFGTVGTYVLPDTTGDKTFYSVIRMDSTQVSGDYGGMIGFMYADNQQNTPMFMIRNDGNNVIYRAVYGASWDYNTGKNGLVDHVLVLSIDSTNKIVKFFIDGESMGQAPYYNYGNLRLGARLNGQSTNVGVKYIGVTNTFDSDDTIINNTKAIINYYGI